MNGKSYARRDITTEKRYCQAILAYVTYPTQNASATPAYQLTFLVRWYFVPVHRDPSVPHIDPRGGTLETFSSNMYAWWFQIIHDPHRPSVTQ